MFAYKIEDNHVRIPKDKLCILETKYQVTWLKKTE
jgi:hypothetical protein